MEGKGYHRLILVLLLLSMQPIIQAGWLIPAVETKHFVFVHGLGHGSWCWYKVVMLLEIFGYTVSTLDLTSNGIEKTIADDVTSLAQYARPLTDLLENVKGKVILVGHSLGGGPVSYALEKFPNKIAKAIFVAALMPTDQSTIVESNPHNTLPNLRKIGLFLFHVPLGSETPTSIGINRTIAPTYFYNSSPTRDAILASSLLNATPYTPLLERFNFTREGYGSVRRFYIRTTKDRIVSELDQSEIIARNPPHRVFTLPNSDHSPFFSDVKAFVRLLRRISYM